MTLDAPRPISATIDTKAITWAVTFDRPIALTGPVQGNNFRAEWFTGTFFAFAEDADGATIDPDGRTVRGTATAAQLGGTHNGHVIYAASPARIVSADNGIPADPFTLPATIV